MIDVLGLYACYALTITFGKSALHYVQPLFFVGVRMLISGPLLLGYVYFFKHSEFRLKQAPWTLFLRSAVMLYGGFAFGFWALNHMSSAKNALIFTLTPFITALLAYFLCAEKLSRKKLIGLTIGFAGAIPSLLSSAHQDTQAASWSLSLPDVAALAAITCGAYGWILASKLTNEYKYSPYMINGVNMFVSSLLLLISSPFIDVWNPLPFTSLAHLVGYVLLLVLVCDVITYNWYIALLHKYSATFLAFAGFTVPLFVALYNFVWLGQVESYQFFVSIGIILVGLFIFYQEELLPTKK